MTDRPLVRAPLTGDQVTASVANADGTANVYITDDPKRNVLTLSLTNGLSDDIVFLPGSPVAYEDLPSGESAVYFYLNGLIDNSDVAAMKLAAPGWAAATFTDPGTTLQYLVIAPVSQVTLKRGASLTFSLTNVLVPAKSRSGIADFQLAGALNVQPRQRDVPLFVNIANPPDPDNKKPLKLTIRFAEPVVYTVPAQALLLQLVNDKEKALVPDGTPAWHGVTPTFQLTFVYGDATGALSTVGEAGGMSMSISNEYGNFWQPPQARNQDQGPNWILQPDPIGGGTVLGTGGNATIEFAINGINPSPLPAGLDETLTVAYLSWRDIPGYNDGCTALPITKKPGPRITRFTADPAMVPFGEPVMQTVLTWSTEHATYVGFDAPDWHSAEFFLPSGSGPVDGGIPVKPGSTVTATAYKDISQQPRSTDGSAAGTENAPAPGDQFITARATLHIGGITRKDLPAGFGQIGVIVVPADAGRVFFFQSPTRTRWAPDGGLTKAAVLDIATRQIIATADLQPLIPGGGGTNNDAAVASPDGRTIHVLAHSGETDIVQDYYILPLEVASARYGQPVPVPPVTPLQPPGSHDNDLLGAGLLATRDGGTVYFSIVDLSTDTGLIVYALDPAGYQLTGSWKWRPAKRDGQWLASGATLVGASADGGVLLVEGLSGLAVLDVTDGLEEKAVLNLNLYAGPLVLNADATRAYVFALDSLNPNARASLLIIDIDLGAGRLSVVHTISLGQVSNAAGAAALSPDGKTLYMLTDVDTMTVMDTATFTAVPYRCGKDGQFIPLLMGTGSQPGVLYCGGAIGIDSNDPVSVVAFI